MPVGPEEKPVLAQRRHGHGRLLHGSGGRRVLDLVAQGVGVGGRQRTRYQGQGGKGGSAEERRIATSSASTTSGSPRETACNRG